MEGPTLAPISVDSVGLFQPDDGGSSCDAAAEKYLKEIGNAEVAGELSQPEEAPRLAPVAMPRAPPGRPPPSPATRAPPPAPLPSEARPFSADFLERAFLPRSCS